MDQVNREELLYHVAVYCRLSKDDEQAGESVSIETQKMILQDYCREKGFYIYQFYVDDGYSGLNFNRPAFTQMLSDIDAGNMLSHLIERIEIGHGKMVDGKKQQDITIVYRFVGVVADGE